MGTRLHVFVTVLTVSALTTGCIFGGGGDDKKRAAAEARAAREAALAQQQPPGARQNPTAPTLKPQATAVQWPSPDELRLDNNASPRPRQRDVKRAQPPAEEVAVQPQPREPVQPVQPLEPEPQPALAGGAVANKGLELSEPPAEPAAASAEAATDVEAHDAAQPAQAVVTPDGYSPQIAQRLRDNPRDLSAHLDHQLQRFLADEPVPDLAALSSLPAEDRELLTALMDGLSNFRNGLRSDNNMLLSKKVRPLLELAARVRSQAELSIPTIALCKGVTGFGNYEPVDGRFVAQRKNETIVYCEVDNVSSQQAADGVWESRLSQEAVLYTEDGQKVWSTAPISTPDRSRNRRQDFFVAQKIALPPNLSIDRYILKFTVTDEQVGRVAEATVPVQIVATIDARPQLGPLAAPGARTTRAPAPAGAAPRQASDRQPAPRADVPRATDTVDGK
jgi:hypothetical protein